MAMRRGCFNVWSAKTKLHQLLRVNLPAAGITKPAAGKHKPAAGRHGSVVALTRCINQLQRKEEFEAAVALRKSYHLLV
ncbi:hypothetical protein F511_23127 [Dorcoceras hygrometricum]|uniref:Uncharacterized protein n=1 Tax=Dorcoceras hygrometricum TaxID=472368 RepID=A0A2Z7ACN7_9LAMI|nr:hypothetical protein F511_23127 [Dorcoceras hygrometricum]